MSPPTRSPARRRRRGPTVLTRPAARRPATLALTAALAGCSTGSGNRALDPPPDQSPSATEQPTSTGAPTATPDPSPSADDAWPVGPELPPATADPQDVVTDLITPWGPAFLPGGSALVTLRDPAEVVLLTAEGPRTLGGDGAEDLATTTQSGGEGGLLGVAVSPDVAEDHLVYLYRTTAEGNEVVRARLDAAAGTLGELQTVLDGIPAAGNHNGGRIAFGPDGHLYVGTGDAGQEGAAQDPGSLAGKILRITADGEPAPGNPTAGSPVWSLGHRNVQGLAWDDEGLLLASEFGQNTFDELNSIVPGGNYGWPEVEGAADVDGFINPIAVWRPDVASPSGVAVFGDDVFIAALRGERLLTVHFGGDGPGEQGEVLVGELGRLRHVAVGPEGALWLLTQNTDGRGDPRPGDDRLVRLTPP